MDELAGHAGKYALQNYQGFCLSMQALYKIRRGGEISAASAMLYSGLEKFSAARYGIFNWILQAEFAKCMALARRPREGLDVFEHAKIDLDESRWYGPELHRIRGELALSNDEGAGGWQAIFSASARAVKQAGEPVVGAQGRDQPCHCRKVGRARGGRVANLASHPREISRRP